MTSRLVAALAALMLALPVSAAEAPPQFAKSSLYKSVRSQLIGMGYAPLPQKRDEDNSFMCGAFEGEPDICKLYPEVVDCGGTGVRPCQFAFRRKSDGRRLTVLTYGEQTSRLMLMKTEWARGD